MESLRKEIQDEMNRTRLDKTRLYELLLKIVGESSAGSAGAQGPAGQCKCTKVEAPAPVAEKPKASTKKTTATKKA